MSKMRITVQTIVEDEVRQVLRQNLGKDRREWTQEAIYGLADVAYRYLVENAYDIRPGYVELGSGIGAVRIPGVALPVFTYADHQGIEVVPFDDPAIGLFFQVALDEWDKVAWDTLVAELGGSDKAYRVARAVGIPVRVR